MSSLRAQAVSGVAWTAVQAWVVRLTTVLAFVVLARALEPRDFGLVAVASAVIALLALVADLGFASYLVQARDVDQRTTSTAFWSALALATGLAGLLALLAAPAARVLGEPDLAAVLRWLCLGLVLTGLSSTPVALLTREMRFRALAERQVLAAVVSAGAAVALALAGAGVWALVAQALLRPLVGAAVLWRSVPWRPTRDFSPGQARTMLSFGAKVAGSAAASQARTRSEDLVLAAVGSAVLLGYWSVATRILTVVLDLCSAVVSQVATPAFARLRDDRRRLHRALEQSLGLSAAVVVPVLAVLCVTGQELVPLVFGEQWRPSAEVAQVLALSAFALTVVGLDRPVLIALGRPGVELWVSAGVVLVHVVVVLLAAPHGLVPLALAVCARAYLTWPVRYLVLRRTAGAPLRIYAGVLRAVVAGVASVVAMVLVQRAGVDPVGWSGVLAVATSGLAAYAAVLGLVARDLVRDGTADLRRLVGR